MITVDSRVDSLSHDDYEAGYSLPQGLWGFGIIAVIGTVVMGFSCIQLLKAYFMIGGSGVPEYTSAAPEVLSQAVIMLILSLMPLLVFSVYYIKLARMVGEQSLLITENGILFMQKGTTTCITPWQEVTALSHLNLNGHAYFLRVVTADGRLSICGSCLFDADKTIELIKKYANLTEQCSDMLWIRYYREAPDSQV